MCSALGNPEPSYNLTVTNGPADHLHLDYDTIEVMQPDVEEFTVECIATNQMEGGSEEIKEASTYIDFYVGCKCIFVDYVQLSHMRKHIGIISLVH